MSGDGAFIEDGIPLPSLVAAFAKIGEDLTILNTGEAIRRDWVASVKDFVSRPDQPAKYSSVVKFVHPRPAATRKSGSPRSGNRSSARRPGSMSLPMVPGVGRDS